LPILTVNDGNFTGVNDRWFRIGTGESIHLLEGSFIYAYGVGCPTNRSRKLIRTTKPILSFVETNYTLEATQDMNYYQTHLLHVNYDYYLDFLLIGGELSIDYYYELLGLIRASTCIYITIPLRPYDTRNLIELIIHTSSNWSHRVCIDSFMSDKYPDVKYSWPGNSLVQNMEGIAIPLPPTLTQTRTYIRRCPIRSK
jgi:hypothetical protein